MTVAEAPPRSAFDLLARRWAPPAPAADLAFNRAGTAAAFAFAGRGLALAETADDAPASGRIRVGADDARLTIAPRPRPPRPLTLLRGAGLGAVVPLGAGGFLAAAPEGGLLHIAPDGALTPVAGAKGMAGPLAAGGGAAAAALCGGDLLVLRETGARRVAPASEDARALALSPDAALIAVASETGVALVRAADGSPLHAPALPGAVSGVSFSPCGGWLGCSLATGGFALVSLSDGAARLLRGYPAPAASIAWVGRGEAVATSGAYRIAAWSLATPPETDEPGRGALRAGTARPAPVGAVAAHPARPLLAAGWADGRIALAALGGAEETTLRGPDGAAVVALAFSPDGGHLAAAFADAEVALIELPDRLLK